MSILLTPPPIAVGTRDLQILAQTILGEAEGEPLQGKVAVAWVIVNRAVGRKLTITAVCLQPKQFSCWNQGSPRISRMEGASLSDPYYRSCYGVGCLVLAGEYADITRGAQFYFTKAAPPWARVWPPIWAQRMVQTAEIGAHVFFKEV